MRNLRSGAATLEMAICLSLFITLVLGMVDLGYGVFRHHVLTQSARQVARQAIVHGSLADRKGSWGPEPISSKASDQNVATDVVASSLVGWKLDDVQLQVQWIDGGNDAREGHRVFVTMSAPYRPIMTFIFGNPSITLNATSTMRIAH